MSEETPRGLTLEPDRSSRHSVGIHASPAEVWLALTDPRELARWFVSEASIDLRAGGAYRWVFGEATGVSGADASVESGEFFRRHAVQFAAGRFVDQIEQARKGIAQIEAAPAGVADVEHAPQFGVDFFRVGEVRTLPGQGMAGRRFETAFTHFVGPLCLLR